MAERTPIYLKDYQPCPYLVENIDLSFDLTPSLTTVESSLAIKAKQPDTTADLVLHGEGLVLKSLYMDDRELTSADYTYHDDKLIIPACKGDFVLKACVEIHPEDNLSMEGLYTSKGNFCTQCEAEGFRKITFNYDRPDSMSIYNVRITADKSRYPVLLSNGNFVEEGDLDDGRHYRVFHDPFPKPAYLFALVAGDYGKISETYQTKSGKSVELEIYAEPKDVGTCHFAMQSLIKSMKWDEDVYGLECDLDHYKIVATGDFNMGAMENKGLNIFNTSLVLADPNLTRDESFQRVLSVVGHEYFHNWTGNRVTCRDWFQLCLKEGLTVFRDQEFSADIYSRPVKRIEDLNLLRLHQWTEDAGPLAHPPRPDHFFEINNFYTTTVYNKGAEVVRMLKMIVGDKGFYDGMRLYFSRHDGQAVTIEDFVAAMADASGHDLNQFLLWYTQAGTPELTVERKYDANRKVLTLKLRQETLGSSENPRHIPIKVALFDERGQPVSLVGKDHQPLSDSEGLLHLRSAEQSFEFSCETSCLPSLFREGSPVKVKSYLSADELLFLMNHDNDPVSVWDAVQSYCLAELLEGAQVLAQDQNWQPNVGIAAAFKQIMQASHFDMAFKALALTIVSESYVAQHQKVVQVEAIHQARETLARFIAHELKSEWQDLYLSLDAGEQGWSASDEEVGRRSLRSVSLGYLRRLETPAVYEWIHKHYHSATNMTDRDAGLACALYSADPKAKELSDTFFKEFADEDLVIDRWFALHASVPMDDPRSQLGKLLEHPAYNWKNPNRMRSVLLTFAVANPTSFHHRSGAGYELCGEYIQKIDKINPQMASRLAKCFHSWRRYDKGRQQQMQSVMKQILAQSPSRDVHEVLTRSLETK